MSVNTLFNENNFDLFCNSLTANSIITPGMTGTTGNFDHITCQTITATTGTFNYVNVSTVTGTTGNFDHITATTGTITNINSTNGSITTIGSTISNVSQQNVDQIRPLILHNNINLDPSRGSTGIGMVAIHNLNGFDTLLDTNAATADRTITFPDSDLTLVGVTGATGVATFSGIWASSQTGAFNIQKVGTLVVCRISPFLATANTAATITSDAFIPAAFRVASGGTGIANPIQVTDSAPQTYIGKVLIKNNGTLQIYSSSDQPFQGVNSSGMADNFILTWHTFA